MLPIGLKRGNDFDDLFSSEKNLKKLVYEPCIINNAASFKNPQIFPMVIKHQRLRTHRKAVSLVQTFSTKSTTEDQSWNRVTKRRRKPNKKVEILFNKDEHISRKNGYYYRWNFEGDLVRISKLIGTVDINQIKQQGISLVNECQRFIFMYCQG